VRKAEDAGAKETREAEKATAAPSLLPRCACLALFCWPMPTHTTHTLTVTHTCTRAQPQAPTHISREGETGQWTGSRAQCNAVRPKI
jgi:hypothetical protein